MSYPNVIDYIGTNKVNIETVRELCEEERTILESAILDAANEATTNSESVDVFEPLQQEITHALGEWWFSIDGTIPTGGIPHLGHIVSRSTYGDFYKWIESTKVVLTDEEWLAYADSHGGCCPHYSSGDGSTTFRTPKYDNTFLKVVSTINGTGAYEEEGLPNITGTFALGDVSDVYTTYTNHLQYGDGAFYSDGTISANTYNESGTSTDGNIPKFNASRCSSVYGNSEHVTPKNISFIVGVYVVGYMSQILATDAANLLNAVTRVEAEYNEISTTKVDKTSVSSYFLPNYSAGVLCGKNTSSTSPVTYTAPSNGIIFVDHLIHNNSGNPAYIKINGVAVVSNVVPNTSYYTGTTYTAQTVYFYPFKEQ